MKMVALPSGKQRSIHGPAVNVPSKIDTICDVLSSKFLSMAKEGCEIVSIEDIGETVPNDEVLQEDYEELTDAEIVGVAYLEQYRSCLRW